jgi:hypothetical protein
MVEFTKEKQMLPGETVLSGAKGATVEDFKVMWSNAGYYIGTERGGYPYSRETGYFSSRFEADVALAIFQKTGQLKKQRY